MKKLIFTLSLFSIIAVANAQYCGTSGSSVCTPHILPAPGLSPVSDSLAPVIDGTPTATTIYFQNFDTVAFGNPPHTLHIDSLHIDTISNLPSGLCWATSKSDNTFDNQENGCIQVTGTTTAPCGQYKLYIIVTAYIGAGTGIQTNADAAGLKYFVRVNSSDTAAVQAVDSTQTVANPFEAYSGCYGVGIKPVDQNIQSLNVYPNPFNDQTVVSFNSVKAGVMTEKITSIIGSEVFNRSINVTLGANTQIINRNNLSAGVYFYTLSDGTSTFTKRLVIGE